MIDAKAAANAADKAIQEKVAAARAERTLAEKRAAAHKEWLMAKGVAEVMHSIETAIQKAADAGEYHCTFEFPFHDEDGKIVSHHVQEKLAKMGYLAPLKRTYVQADRGSHDDGYAYAHDAYDLWSAEISWALDLSKSK